MAAQRRWRIDELAQEAGLTVDTIRFYTREGLLPPPERAGRNKLYGPRHLERLERIADLRDRRFSLAAIKALLEAERPGMDALFAGQGHTYTLDELAERSALDPAFVRRLRDVGLLPAPDAFGREAYDAADLDVLDAIAELEALGMERGVVADLSAIYVRHFDQLQRDVHALFAGQTRDDWDPGELQDLQDRLTRASSRLIPALNRVLGYVHQRTMQRMTLEAMQRARSEGTGFGGRRYDATG